jgi:phosphodiesterase/alkaline phosphatase D-like protein
MRKYFFTRRAVLSGALAGVFAMIAQGKSAAATPISVKTSSDQTGKSIDFKVTASLAVSVFIEYGTSKGVYKSKSTTIKVAKNSTQSVLISSLTPNTRIYYRVRYSIGTGKTIYSLASSSLLTSDGKVSNVFAVQADPHMDENSSGEIYDGTLKQIVAASPAFLMDLGDIFMVDKLADKSEKNIRARFELMKSYYDKLGSVPFKITLGNHDGELGYSKFNTKSYRKEYFPEQTGELAYYAFTLGDSLHISLDPFTYTTSNPKVDGWQWTLGKTQYDWFRSTLENSQAKYKFIYIHHLLVGDAQSRGGVEIAGFNEWGGKNKDGTYGFDSNRPGWGKPIHQLLKENKVTIVFKGHDHLYVKQELDGIVYQSVPQPSHAGDKVNSATEYGYIQGKVVGGSGYMKVSTGSSNVQVEFVKWDGSIADTYTCGN